MMRRINRLDGIRRLNAAFFCAENEHIPASFTSDADKLTAEIRERRYDLDGVPSRLKRVLGYSKTGKLYP